MKSQVQKIIAVSAMFGAGVGLGVACKSTELNGNHCNNNDGDAFCAAKYPDGSKPYCTVGSCRPDLADGCSDTRPGDDSCYSPCGGMSSLADNPDCMTASGTGGTASSSGPSTVSSSSQSTTMTTSSATNSTTASTTMGTGTGTGGGCSTDAECSGDTPFCIGMTCVSCDATPDGDAACANLDPNAPLCNAGTCVQCTDTNADACSGNTPTCDTSTNTCVACSFHRDCPDSACKIDTGECFDKADVQMVASTGLASAIMNVSPGADAVFIVSGANDLNAALTVDNGKHIAILRTPGAGWSFVNTMSTNPTIDVSGSMTRLYLENVVIRQGSGIGLSVAAGHVYLDETEVVNNSGGGISLTSSAYLQARNCFVNGGVDVDALNAMGSSFDILYSTLGGEAFTSTAITCSALNSGTVRNSLVLTRGTSGTVQCPGISVSYSALDEANTTGTGNVTLPATDPMWFSDYNNGNFHLTSMAPNSISTAAQWATGDPAWDIDGDARPMTDGASDYAGADVP